MYQHSAKKNPDSKGLSDLIMHIFQVNKLSNGPEHIVHINEIHRFEFCCEHQYEKVVKYSDFLFPHIFSMFLVYTTFEMKT